MNTMKLTQTRIAFLIVWLREHVVQFTGARSTRYESRSRSQAVAQLQMDDPARDERLFRQAMQDNSNLEFDWLWCAANMSSVTRQRYCLLRALEINSNSDLAQRALATLPSEASDEAIALASQPGV